MAITVRRLHPLFVGEVGQVNLAAGVDAVEARQIIAALDEYAVLVFRDQPLSDVQQLAFANAIGTPQVANRVVRAEKDRLTIPQLIDISNLNENQEIMGADDRRRMRNLGNRLWHTDASFLRVRGRYSMLSSRVVPTVGGETEYADMRAAYDALPAEMKVRIADLTAEHAIMHSRARLGFTDFSDTEREAMPPVVQPVVHRHPGSNRMSLYLASHASHIVGWPVPEGRMLLHDLMEFATQPRFVYSHDWRPNDLVIWDNRCTMHRGRPFDETQVRDLRRITTEDRDPARASAFS